MGNSLDLLFTNGQIIDGSGGPPFTGNIGIRNDEIVLCGDDTGESDTVIDLGGLFISPGFIDTHGHSEFTMIAAPECESKVMQGVTTEINGNCGLSAGPLFNEARERREEDFREVNIPFRWSSISQYMALLLERKPVINYATLTGQGNIRASVMGYENRRPDNAELERMRELLSNDLDSGVLGCSTGLIYPPGVFTDKGELIELLAPFGRRKDLIYTTHMRSEGDRLEESVEESLETGMKAGWMVHLSHLKTGGKKNWHKIDRVLGIIDRAYRNGSAVTFDRYPYTASSTDLDTILPSWMYEGGNEEECKRLANPDIRKELIQYLREAYGNGEGYRGIYISSVTLEENRWMEGRSVAEISEELNKPPEHTVLDLLLAERIRVGAIFESMSEDNLRTFLVHPLCMVGSDSSVRNFSGVTARGKPHPRAFGTFPRYLGKYIIGGGLLPLEEGIRRITSFPADTFGINRRGRLQRGYKADLVVFDAGTLQDRATYQDPFRKPQGVLYVIINGKIVVSEGEPVRDIRPGMVLKRDRAGHGNSPVNPS